MTVSPVRQATRLLLALAFVICCALSPPVSARAAGASSLKGTVDVARKNVTILGTADADTVVVINGRQLRTGGAGTFSGSFSLTGTALIAVLGKNRPGFSVLLSLPTLPAAAVHVLPTMTFTYDGVTRRLALAGEPIRRPAGAVRGYVSVLEAAAAASFAVGKDNRFSTAIRLGAGVNTVHSSVRYLLVMRYTLPDFVITVGPVPRVIVSLQVGSPRMTVNGTARTVDAQGTRPVIMSSTTMVPIRAIIESLGGSISWDGADCRLDLRLDGRTVTLWVGRTSGRVNGRTTTMSTAPVVVGGRTMIPLRFVAEGLGCLVGWDQASRSATIVGG